LELWLPVSGLEDRYEVSDHGNVRGIDRWRKSRWEGQQMFVPGVPIKQADHRQGYKQVYLGVGVKQKKWFLVHRLALSTFAPIDGWQQLQVNHQDGVTSNNHLSNLEWVTPSQNRDHACRVLGKGIGSKHGRAKLTEEQVLVIRQIKGRSQQSIADEYGVSQVVISSILRRKTWTHL
jgi:hypothetical protein